MSTKVTPIFIMGAPRSGTTFLASSIASHPSIVALPEMHYIFELMEQELLFGELGLDQKTSILINSFHFCSLRLFDDVEGLKKFIGNKNVKAIILGLVSLFNEKHDKKDYQYWVEHTPHSHRFIEVLKIYFPDAIFVHCIRDPRSVVASTFKEPWGYKDVITGAEDWNNKVMGVLKKEKLYDIKTIRYEDFTEDIEINLKRLCKKIGVDYHYDMLSNTGVVMPEFFEKQQRFSGEKVDKGRKEKWKKDLCDRDILHIQAVNHKLMQKYGYLSGEDVFVEITGLKRTIIKVVGRIKYLYLNKIFKRDARKTLCQLK